MKKKELFLMVLIIFCAGAALARPLKNKVDTKMQEEIPESLPMDKKFFGPENIDMFHEMNPTIESKNKDYWDLAWHAKTADYGDKQSQFLMARAYEFGKEVDSNPRKALVFYKRAAEQNHLESCMRLGQIYTEEKWVKADIEQAIFWYKRAARLGYIPAALKLGEIYGASDNDLVEAYFWTARATKQMFPDSEDLEDKNPRLKELSNRMTDEELRQAKGMLAP